MARRRRRRRGSSRRATVGTTGPAPAMQAAGIPAPPKNHEISRLPSRPPDVDKLQRAIGDALTKSKVITDDARIVQWVAGKRWAPPGLPAFAAVQLDYYPPTED
jgi:hypothetical protein